jgi:hypothetical protein
MPPNISYKNLLQETLVRENPSSSCGEVVIKYSTVPTTGCVQGAWDSTVRVTIGPQSRNDFGFCGVSGVRGKKVDAEQAVACLFLQNNLPQKHMIDAMEEYVVAKKEKGRGRGIVIFHGSDQGATFESFFRIVEEARRDPCNLTVYMLDLGDEYNEVIKDIPSNVVIVDNTDDGGKGGVSRSRSTPIFRGRTRVHS